MYLLAGGYLCTPKQIKEWFKQRGVELSTKDHYAIQGNRYLRDHNFHARIRSCEYQGKQRFIVLTHTTEIHDYIAIYAKYECFEEDAEACAVKEEMGLRDVEFVTHTIYLY